ncbi:MAG: hypothetical protein ACE5GA_03370 [Candidatus Zixiibacteriota bacterium]
MVSERNTCVRLAALCLLALTTFGCGTQPKPGPEQPYWVDNDRKSFPEPESRDPVLAWVSTDRTGFVQALELADLDRDFRVLFNKRKEAGNINSMDEVPNSSWFTNRHGMNPLTPEEIRRGVALTDGPDTSGTWILSRPKVGGATPGFWITDSRGDTYIIKFDPPDNPELATAASAMASRYLRACGYNVPQETIVYWRPDRIVIKEGVKCRDVDGITRLFTSEKLNNILADIRRTPDGLIRSSASLLIPNAKGPFSYYGRRRDDPNDWLPHQDRRELRGLYVVGSWVNHYDLKDHNTLDGFVETEPGRGYLKHYLIDFGSTFGADGDGVKHPRKGYANWFDLRDALVSTFTIGLKRWDWEKAKGIQHPSIGYFESDLFQPNKFDPIVPNPAFENLTARDAFWGAKIVMAFRDEHIRALVESGEYSDPAAAEYLFRTLKKRRDKIGRHWFSKVNPVDDFSLSAADGTMRIRFADLSVKYGLTDASTARYNYQTLYNGRTIAAGRDLSATELAIGTSELDQMVSAFDGKEHLYEIELLSRHAGGASSSPTTLWLWFTPESRDWKLVGISR